MNNKYDNDKRIFSIYMSEVKQTLDPIEALHLTAWITDKSPEIFDDLTAEIRDLYDITITDYRQFAEQVIEFEESVVEDANVADWIASE